VPERTVIQEIPFSRGVLSVEIVRLHGKRFAEIRVLPRHRSARPMNTRERLRLPLCDHRKLAAAVMALRGGVRRELSTEAKHP
jgi:hypothetical protein